MVTSAWLAPRVGRALDRGQGASVLRIGLAAALAGLVVLALWRDAWALFAGWSLVGVAMSALLYEPAFALVQRAVADPGERLRALAAVTVMGGFASTIFLPLLDRNPQTGEALDYAALSQQLEALRAKYQAAKDDVTRAKASGNTVETVRAYQLSFQPAAKMLEATDGNKVRLTDKETSILKYLYRSGAKSVSREELLTEVWGYNAGVTTHTLETHIYRLRQKIEPDPGNARLLMTDPGGYRLQA